MEDVRALPLPSTPPSPYSFARPVLGLWETSGATCNDPCPPRADSLAGETDVAK